MATETELPWEDITQWTPELWYPLPVGYHARDFNPSLYIINGYGIYKQDPKQQTDATQVVDGVFTFADALAICEGHNEEKLLDG